MRDTYRRYRAIARCLLQLYPQAKGHQRRHLHTLTLLICGIVGAQHAQLPKIVEHTPGGRACDESVVMRFRRFLKHDETTYERWMLPIAQTLVTLLARLPLLFVIDGSTVGRGCMCLMLSVVYHRRALPLVWVVVQASKGHLPQSLHCELLAQLVPLVPHGADVTILGDGEFDGTLWQADITAQGWRYVCRTASDILLTRDGATITMRDLATERGETVALEQAAITGARYGPVNALAVWKDAYEQPLYLVTTHTDLALAVAFYRRRAQIETYFSDQKSRGFRINRSHLSEPVRVSRLLLATALAYLWVVYLGVVTRRDALRGRIHRPDRCDLSLFSLGLRLLAYYLRHRL
ncbi:MAG TPA: transposase [Roseiflexaceae bacterium]|nr:transposase [Roseiflexaceae bacterium]